MGLKNMKELAVLCKNEGYTPEIIAMGEAAMEEIRALEQAAKDFSSPIGSTPNQFVRPMESIAREAK